MKKLFLVFLMLVQLFLISGCSSITSDNDDVEKLTEKNLNISYKIINEDEIPIGGEFKAVEEPIKSFYKEDGITYEGAVAIVDAVFSDLFSKEDLEEHLPETSVYEVENKNMYVVIKRPGGSMRDGEVLFAVSKKNGAILRIWNMENRYYE